MTRRNNVCAEQLPPLYMPISHALEASSFVTINSQPCLYNLNLTSATQWKLTLSLHVPKTHQIAPLQIQTTRALDMCPVGQTLSGKTRAPNAKAPTPPYLARLQINSDPRYCAEMPSRTQLCMPSGLASSPRALTAAHGHHQHARRLGEARRLGRLSAARSFTMSWRIGPPLVPPVNMWRMPWPTSAPI